MITLSSSRNNPHTLTHTAHTHCLCLVPNVCPVLTPPIYLYARWNFVAQLRASSPYPLQGVLWFGVDDSSTTARFPVYGCSTYAPRGWAGKGAQDGVTPPMMTFDMSQVGDAHRGPSSQE